MAFKQNKVSLYKTNYSNLDETMNNALNNFENLEKSKNKILIKINLCDFRDYTSGATTDPHVLDSLLRDLRKKHPDREIIVIESNATSAQPDLLIQWLGLDTILKKYNVAYTNLSKEKYEIKEINGRHLKKIRYPLIFDDSFVINLPKLKTHSLSKISCSLKNHFGSIPIRNKIRYHKKLDDVIVDANILYPSDLCIVDGIISMIGSQGPTYGTPLKTDLMIFGSNPVSVDSVCAKILGFNPNNVSHIRKASIQGLGTTKYSCDSVEKHKIKSEFGIIEPLLIRIAAKMV